MKTQLKKLGLSIDWDKYQLALRNIININKIFFRTFGERFSL